MVLEGVLSEKKQAELQTLQQQGTHGDVNTERPGGYFNGDAKAKWDAWNYLKGTPKQEAQIRFIT